MLGAGKGRNYRSKTCSIGLDACGIVELSDFFHHRSIPVYALTMRTIATGLICGLFAISVAMGATPTEGDKRLHGTWLVIKMYRGKKPVAIPNGSKLTMQFDSEKHSWQFRVVDKDGNVHDEGGWWKLRGSRLTTQSTDNKMDRLKVDFPHPQELVLERPREKLVFQRLE